MDLCIKSFFNKLFAKIYLLLFFMICENDALDLEQLITVNKPVLKDEIPPLSNGSVRCFCNLSECVSTGYMCKSSAGRCFSDLYHHSSPHVVYHGCIEQLNDFKKKDWCQNHPNGKHTLKTSYKSLLHCCHEDMCNHPDDPLTKDLINGTSLGDVYNNDENRAVESHLDNGYNNADVWFKAATIAVPICGAVILFVLIALAIRLLKNESLHNSNYKLGCSYQHPHSKHNCDKHHEHYHTSQSLLRKEGIVANQMYLSHVDYPRHSLTPIVIKKNVNERNDTKINYFQGQEYKLLPRNPQVFEVHKCIDSKINLTPDACRLNLCSPENVYSNQAIDSDCNASSCKENVQIV